MAGIYVHIPYCHSKCAYCDFYSMPLRGEPSMTVDCIISEYAMRRDEVDEPVRTLYLGGGTPSILGIADLARLAAALSKPSIEEFTIEANPEDVTAEKIEAWRRAGVNRVSMGVQSLVDEELKLIGRRHTAEDAVAAVETLRAGGIGNISLDLIYGLPGQTPESWQYSLQRLLQLRPEHLSAYMLSYEDGTRLSAMLRTGKIQAVGEDDLVQMYGILTAEASRHGYEHYEISNFALEGRQSRHNSSYWDGTPYIGLGPAAHSYDGSVRRINPANIKEYTASISKGQTAYTIDDETPVDKLNDVIITRLRTARGLDTAQVPRRYMQKLMCNAYPHIKNGDLTLHGATMRIPEERYLISDTILRDLIL